MKPSPPSRPETCPSPPTGSSHIPFYYYCCYYYRCCYSGVRTLNIRSVLSAAGARLYTDFQNVSVLHTCNCAVRPSLTSPLLLQPLAATLLPSSVWLFEIPRYRWGHKGSALRLPTSLSTMSSSEFCPCCRKWQDVLVLRPNNIPCLYTRHFFIHSL